MFKTVLILHLLGATIWTGGHMILCFSVLPNVLKTRDIKPLQMFETHFERIGMPALFVQVLTGFHLASTMLPLTEWFKFDSYVNTHISVKVILLLLTLILAIHAKVKLLPNLSDKNLNSLACHIVAVTIISILFAVLGVGIKIGGIF